MDPVSIPKHCDLSKRRELLALGHSVTSEKKQTVITCNLAHTKTHLQFPKLENFCKLQQQISGICLPADFEMGSAETYLGDSRQVSKNVYCL
jgi:hypothetical protein